MPRRAIDCVSWSRSPRRRAAACRRKSCTRGGWSPAACAGEEAELAADVRFDSLAAELEAALGSAVATFDDATFERWAERLFAWQIAHNPAYRGYCEGRAARAISRWREIPPVPTAAFKHLNLLSVEPGRAAEAVFHTSGTTRGAERRGQHPVARLALYRAAALPPFREHVLAGATGLGLLSLVPSPAAAPHSSLSRMIGMAAAELGARDPWLARADGSVRVAEALAAARAAVAADRPVLVTATAFALVQWLDALSADGVALRLPAGSRLMETGGFKGRVREVARADLYDAVEERLGIQRTRIVNEYGMTELLSQFYEPVLSEPAAPAALDARVHRAPAWVRTRVLDPVTLAELPAGAPGLLCHFDLANAGSVCCVLTEDLGVAAAGGFRLLGRLPGAEPRGCSLATEDLLAAARRS